MSLHTINKQGVINQIRPSYKFYTIADVQVTKKKLAIWHHANYLNWYL